MNRYLALVAAALGVATAAPASAAALVSGSVTGPDNGTTIVINIANDASSTVTIKSIRFDGTTANAFPLIWDGVGPSSGPNSFAQLVFVDEDTPVLTVEFISSFDPGESFSMGPMDVDGGPTPVDVMVSQLLGVEVLFTFSDNSTALYEFIDDPAPGKGLVLGLPTAAIPEPGTLPLAGIALAGLVLARRRSPPPSIS
jgi:hypothetical protein